VCLTLTLTVAAVAGCSDDSGTPSSTTSPIGTLAPDATTVIGGTFAPQTTFMPDCAAMPTPADLSSIVGVPLAEGRVAGAGTCEFLGLNDQSRSVLLALLTDPSDQATYADLEASLGAATPLDDPALPGAMISASSAVYVTAAGGLYSVKTAVTDAPLPEQVPLSVAVLKHWLAL
jgi:hypothetical protein